MFVDRRLYRTPEWHLQRPLDYWMLVPQILLNSVVFLGEMTAGGPRYAGTGYFVSVPADWDPDQRFVYLVTARHCVEGRTDIIARLNNGSDPASGTTVIQLPDGDKWWWQKVPGPGEDYVDLAVMLVPQPEEVYAAGYRWAPATMFFDESYIGDDPIRGVGLGDEVVAVGLLLVHYGKEHNEPVVRTGNLSLIPREPVLVRYAGGPDRRMRLYLTELRSIGGLSGSPVFIRHRHMIGQETVPMSLLGTMIGHWDDPNRNHMGFGKVVPAPLLAKLLNQEDLVNQRKKSEPPNPPDTATAHADQVPGEATEYERFNELTKNLVQVPKSEVDEKRRAKKDVG